MSEAIVLALAIVALAALIGLEAFGFAVVVALRRKGPDDEAGKGEK